MVSKTGPCTRPANLDTNIAAIEHAADRGDLLALRYLLGCYRERLLSCVSPNGHDARTMKERIAAADRTAAVLAEHEAVFGERSALVVNHPGNISLARTLRTHNFPLQNCWVRVLSAADGRTRVVCTSTANLSAASKSFIASPSTSQDDGHAPVRDDTATINSAS